ncbi:MAG: DUF721 domain-containing protein [Nitrospirae bacterium]|nr:DUF721 domain-containing protein [Nitrospirota bacterium]
MHSLNTVLNKFVKDFGLEGGAALTNLQKKWSDIAGQAIASHTSPFTIKNGVLILTVDTPQWMHHLSFLKEEILDKLEKFNVSEVRFKLGKLPAPAHTVADNCERMLTGDDKRFIENTLRSIKDKELKKSFRRLLTHALTTGKQKI